MTGEREKEGERRGASCRAFKSTRARSRTRFYLLMHLSALETWVHVRQTDSPNEAAAAYTPYHRVKPIARKNHFRTSIGLGSLSFSLSYSGHHDNIDALLKFPPSHLSRSIPICRALSDDRLDSRTSRFFHVFRGIIPARFYLVITAEILERHRYALSSPLIASPLI